MPSIDVDKLIGELVTREGGYSNHPADRGGPTNWGITEQVARAYGYHGDMRNFSRSAAELIYRTIYWTRPGFDRVAQRYPRVAAELFDTGVNMGVKIAGRFLQRALNGLNRGGADYADLKIDDDVGPLTLAALDGFKRRRGATGESVLVKALECQQGARYLDLVEARPANEAFFYGWLANRIGQV